MFSHTTQPSLFLPFRQEHPPLLHVYRPRDLYHWEQELDFRCVDWEAGAEESICPRTSRGILASHPHVLRQLGSHVQG